MKLPKMTASHSLFNHRASALFDGTVIPCGIEGFAQYPSLATAAWDGSNAKLLEALKKPVPPPEDHKGAKPSQEDLLVAQIVQDINSTCDTGGVFSWPKTVSLAVAQQVADHFSDENGPFGANDCAMKRPCQQKLDNRYAFNFWGIHGGAGTFNYHLYVPNCG